MGSVLEVATLVRRASDLSPAVAGTGVDRLLPVRSDLQPLLPFGGLRRGSTVGVAYGGSPGAMSLMLALIARASQEGSWCAIVGVPYVGLVAAAELGVVLERTALIPYPGAAVDRVVGTLLDGFDIVVAAIPVAGLPASLRKGWTARTRRNGGVLIPWCDRPGGWSWEGADLVLSTRSSVWHGLGQGRGRLRARELTVAATGRGAAARPREATIWLPRHPSWQPSTVEDGLSVRPSLRLVS